MAHSIFEVLHIVFKHRLLVVGTFVGVFLFVATGAWLRADEYRASGRLMVTGQRSYFRLAPNGTRSREKEPEQRDINTEIENLKSLDFLVKVAADLSSQQTKQGRVSDQAIPSAPSSNNQQQRGEALSPPALQHQLEVTAVPNSSLIEVAYVDADPERASAVVNAVLEYYPRYQASLHQEPAALEFYEKQQGVFEKEIGEAEKEFRTYQEENSLFYLQQQRDQALDRIELVRGRLRGTLTDLDQGIGKIATIERELKQSQKRMVTSQEIVNPEASLLNDRLVELEIDRFSLLQRYTEKDRRVRDLAREIEVIKKKLVDTAGHRVVVEERIGIDPVYQDLIRELSEQRVKQGQQQAKKINLEGQVQQYTAEARELNSRSYEYQHREETLTQKKELYNLYSRKAEEARIAAAMNREELVNVKLVDSARIPSAPLAAGVFFTLMLAAIVGAGAGVGGALTLEYIRPTFHSVIDIERELELPVIALVPDLRELA